jgi:hypothetical protein
MMKMKFEKHAVDGMFDLFLDTGGRDENYLLIASFNELGHTYVNIDRVQVRRLPTNQKLDVSYPKRMTFQSSDLGYTVGVRVEDVLCVTCQWNGGRLWTPRWDTLGYVVSSSITWANKLGEIKS